MPLKRFEQKRHSPRLNAYFTIDAAAYLIIPTNHLTPRHSAKSRGMEIRNLEADFSRSRLMREDYYPSD